MIPTSMSIMIKDATENSPPRVHAPGMRTFLWTMLAILIVRICILCTGLLSIGLAAPGSAPQFNIEHPWLAFDARSYHEIALHGYAASRDGPYLPYLYANSFVLIAYFPVIPLVSRALSSIMPLDVAMVGGSNVCSIIGFVFLYAWARRLAGPRAAVICALITATFPGAVSFAAGMTEGQFFMLVAIALWLLGKDCFYWAAVVAGIATATRPTGIALAVIVPIFAWVRQETLPRSRRLTSFVLLGAISLSGIIGYEAFLWHRYQSPAAYWDAQNHWNNLNQMRLLSEGVQHVDRRFWPLLRDRIYRPQIWNRGMAMAILLISLAGFAKPRGIPRVTFLLPLVIFLMTSIPGRGMRISSVPRYESAALPLFLLTAMWLLPRRRGLALAAFLVAQFAVQVYYAALFTREIWVG